MNCNTDGEEREEVRCSRKSQLASPASHIGLWQTDREASSCCLLMNYEASACDGIHIGRRSPVVVSANCLTRLSRLLTDLAGSLVIASRTSHAFTWPFTLSLLSSRLLTPLSLSLSRSCFLSLSLSWDIVWNRRSALNESSRAPALESCWRAFVRAMHAVNERVSR